MKNIFQSSSNQALFDSIKNQRYRQVFLLLQNGANVNYQNELGETPLIYLSKTFKRKENKKIRTKFAKLLIDFGSNVNIQDFQGMSVLIHASKQNQEDIVHLLLSKNETDVTIQDKEGNSALMYAAKFGFTSIVQEFIQSFIKRNIDTSILRLRNNFGLNALDLAKEQGNTECIHFLTNYLTQFNSIFNHDLQNWSVTRPALPTSKSFDSISIDSDRLSSFFYNHQDNFQSSSLNRRKLEQDSCQSISGYDDFDILKKKIQNTKMFHFSNDNIKDFYHDLWEQETLSWFSNDRESFNVLKFSENLKNDQQFRLPPIDSNKMIDYKTWFENLGSNFFNKNGKENVNLS